MLNAYLEEFNEVKMWFSLQLSFSSHFGHLALVVFGDEVTKILRNSLITFFTEQGKAGKTEI